MKLISGLNRPTAGRVVVGDIEVKAPLKNVGMAFQNPALLPVRTTLKICCRRCKWCGPTANAFGENGSNTWKRRKLCSPK
jgi:ABC-type Fe3+/spermidine/putrescine transport system ATPase subunit